MQLKIYESIPIEIIQKLKDKKNEYIVEPFLDPSWTETWWKNIGNFDYTELRYFIFSVNNEPILILPLVKKKFYFIRYIEVAGGIVSDYLTPIFKKKYKFSKDDFIFMSSEILRYFKKCDFLFFRKQKNSYNYTNPLFLFTKPIMGLHKSYNINFQKFPQNVKIKKIISDNNRQLRRLSNFGKTQYVEAQNYNIKKKILKTLIQQKEQRYIKTKVWNMFKKENYKNFYFDFLNIDFNFFKIHISAIELNNNYISTHLGIQNDKNYFYLMPSFNSDSFQKFSTGNILLEKLVNYSKLNKLEVFDFTIGGENYKKKWINNSIDLYDLIIQILFWKNY